MSPTALWERYLAASTHVQVILALFVIILGGELLLGKAFPKSAAYRGWKHFFERLGDVWSIVLLSIIYFVAVGPVALGMRLAGSDLLDVKLAPEPSFWRRHDRNPLGPLRAARHQF